MNEFCLAFLILCLRVDISYSQRWWYVPVPTYALKQPANTPANSGYNVAGWNSSPTTEPPLGPNDRMNTTDVPEEIEARPDKTRAQRRQLLKRMNPGFTNAQIEAQLIRDDKARAKMAATQSEPVVILPEPVTAPTKPPPVTTPKPKPKPQPKPKQTKATQANKNNVWQPTSAGKFGSIVKKPVQQRPGQQQRPQRNQQRGANIARNARRRRPRTTTTTTTTEPYPTEPYPTTYPPTYPPTTDFIPTTYATPPYQYNDPIVNNRAMRRGPPPRRQPPMRRQQAPRRNNRPRPRPLVGSEIGHILSIVG